jgi:hypothetical protein
MKGSGASMGGGGPNSHRPVVGKDGRMEAKVGLRIQEANTEKPFFVLLVWSLSDLSSRLHERLSYFMLMQMNQMSKRR